MNVRRPLLLAAAGTAAVLTVATTAATYALYSDFGTATGNSATAATVALGSGDGAPPALAYPALQQVGDVREGVLTIDYRGTVPADVTLSLEPGTAPGLCMDGADGPQNTPGTVVLVEIDGAGEIEYCSFLGSRGATIAQDVPPGTPVTAVVTLRLTQNAGATRIDVADGFVIEARGGFSDTVRGTLTAAVEPIVLASQEQLLAAESSTVPDGLAAALTAPSARQAAAPIDPALVPRECRDAGMEFRLDQVVQLTQRDRPWVADDVRAAPAEPLLIFGTDTDDDITGSAAPDCIVGGDGADRIRGAGGDDVLIGGPVADVLDGGGGADRLHGDADTDDLVGGPGADRLDGGPDGANCDVAPTDRVVRCDPPAEPTAAATPAPSAVPGPVTEPTPVPPVEPVPAPPVQEAPQRDPPVAEHPDPDEPGAAATTSPPTGRVSDLVPEGAA